MSEILPVDQDRVGDLLKIEMVRAAGVEVNDVGPLEGYADPRDRLVDTFSGEEISFGNVVDLLWDRIAPQNDDSFDAFALRISRFYSETADAYYWGNLRGLTYRTPTFRRMQNLYISACDSVKELLPEDIAPRDPENPLRLADGEFEMVCDWAANLEYMFFPRENRL